MSLTLTLPPAETTPKAKGKKAKATKTPAAPKSRPWLRKDTVVGAGFFGLAIAVLSVSLPHLAEGMQKTLGVGWFAAGALAVLFDLSQLAAEAFLLLVAKKRPEDGKALPEEWVAKGVIGGATFVSIAYNGMAFWDHAEGIFGAGAALLLAVLLPVGVLAMSFLGSRALFRK